ncbi:MAG: hypothetical protein L6R30_24820 [Thermoanaerobaculia bacterium]|nr:hypothetical protein [Thermoanaerobaculia bacterium]
MNEGIELKQVVDQLRQDLFQLSETKHAEGLRFAVESVEVELHLAVKKEGSGSAKVQFWVVEAGAGASHSVEHTQTIRLKLAPRPTDGGAPREMLISR